MRGVVPGASALALLLVPGLTRGSPTPHGPIQGESVPTAYISVKLPEHLPISRLPLRLNVLESQEQCGEANITINGETLPQGGTGSFTARPYTVFSASWNLTCVDSADRRTSQKKEQLMNLRVHDVSGIPVEHLEISLRFRQVSPLAIFDLEGPATMSIFMETPRSFAAGTDWAGDDAGGKGKIHGLAAGLDELEDLKTRAVEIQRLILLKEMHLRDTFGWSERKGLRDCDSLKCVVSSLFSKVSDAAKSWYGDDLAEFKGLVEDDWRGRGWGRGWRGRVWRGRHGHHRGPPHWRHEGPPPGWWWHKERGRHDNHTRHHMPPWHRPHHNFPVPPFCRCGPEHGPLPHSLPPPPRPSPPPLDGADGVPPSPLKDRPEQPMKEGKGAWGKPSVGLPGTIDDDVDVGPGPGHPPPPPEFSDGPHSHYHVQQHDGRPPPHGSPPGHHHGPPPPPHFFAHAATKIGIAVIVLGLILVVLLRKRWFRPSSLSEKKLSCAERHTAIGEASRRRKAARKATLKALLARLPGRPASATNGEDDEADKPSLVEKGENGNGNAERQWRGQNPNDTDDDLGNTMEEEIAGFRTAVDVVSDMVAAEERRVRQCQILLLQQQQRMQNNQHHRPRQDLDQRPPPLQQHLHRYHLPAALPSPTTAFPNCIPIEDDDDTLPPYDDVTDQGVTSFEATSGVVADGFMYRPGSNDYSPGSSGGRSVSSSHPGSS